MERPQSEELPKEVFGGGISEAAQLTVFMAKMVLSEISRRASCTILLTF